MAVAVLAPQLACTRSNSLGSRVQPLSADLDTEYIHGRAPPSVDRPEPDEEPEAYDDGSPVFSVERGFFDGPLTVELTSSGTSIYYTTDGSTPNPTTGLEYTGPISIETTTPLRAMAVLSNGALSPVVTQTYIRLSDVVRQPDSPPGYPQQFAANDGLGPYPADYEMDPEVVDDPRYAPIIEDALRDLPTVSIVTDIANLFDATTGIYTNPAETGDDWERPASVEMFGAAQGTLFATNAGIRIHGQASRKPSWTPKRGFRMYFRSSYGLDRLEVPLFEEPGAVDTFDTLVLRSISNYSWIHWNESQRRNALYMRDEFARRSQLAMGQPSAHGRFVHVYLNGLYWGIYNLVERVDNDFLVDYLGNYDTGWDVVTMVNGDLVADEGDLVAYEDLMTLVDAGVEANDAYDEVCKRLDVDNLIDYLIVTHWVANTDWPQRNWYAARPRNDDGKFIFIAWDSDTSLSSPDRNTISEDLDGSPAHLFQALSRNAEFRMRYADRIYAHLYNDGALSTANATARFRELTDQLQLAITGESARWGDYVRDVYRTPEAGHEAGIAELYTPADHWTPERDRMLASYFPVRSDIVVGEYRKAGIYPDVDPPKFSAEGGEVPAGYVLEIDNTANAGDGTVYYRIGEGDPRVQGGAVSASAIDAGDLVRIPITATTRVRARVLSDDGTWSAIHDVTFTVANER